MSPERPSSRGSAGSKPYTRSLSSPALDMEDSKNVIQCEYPPTPINKCDGQPGFPTRLQYQNIERGYLESLTPRRQGKALISQALFDRIWDVLHNSDNVKENPQFRFWVRKMFTLSKPHTISPGINGEAEPMEQEALLHDGLLVAVREQIYDLLCYCHGSTNHGGRDKTCALIRKHYTWVPKELVAQFIKACPTCIAKRCGHPDTGLFSPSLGTLTASSTISATPIPPKDEPNSPLPSFRDYFNNVDGQDSAGLYTFSNSLPSTPIQTPHSQFVLDPDQLISTPIYELRRYSQLSVNASPGFPVLREVSLYQGLPNGWQFQNVTYRSAHAKYTEYQRSAPLMPHDPSLGLIRPRIPDVVPLFGPEFEDTINFECEESGCALDGNLDTTLGISSTLGGFKSRDTSPRLGYPGQGAPATGDESPAIPIDPLLLSLSGSMRLPSLGDVSAASKGIPLSSILHTQSNANVASPSPALVSPSLVDTGGGDAGAMGPPAELECMDSVKTFRDFVTVRENLNLQLVNSGKNCLGENKDEDKGDESGNNSPTSSDRSDVSRLSLGGASTAYHSAGSPMSTVTTPNTATPVNEAPKKGRAVGGLGLSGEGVDLNAIVRAVSVCGVGA